MKVPFVKMHGNGNDFVIVDNTKLQLEYNKKIIETFSSISDLIIETSSMNDAVNSAYRIAKPNDVVLLSPACSSFDLFENYEDRGNQFKECVRKL